MMRAVDQKAKERLMDHRSIGEAMDGASGGSES